MDLFLLILRLALAGIFGLAGVAKFLDLKGSEKAFKDFGVPAPIAKPSSIALSVFEIAIAVLLLFTTTSWIAAVSAFLIAVTGVILLLDAALRHMREARSTRRADVR